MTPTVSVIIATFQQAKWLQCAIDSVLTQTFQDFELIIIDNGSTDGSDEIILAAAEKDPRIDYTLYVENGPVTQRLNAAIRQAKGRWISLLYGDDYYLPEKLRQQLAYAEELTQQHGTAPRIIYGPGYRLSREDSISTDPTCRASGWILEHLFRTAITEGFINPISPMIRRDCFDDEPFDETVFMEGETWYWRAAKHWPFYFLDVPLVVMRSHDRNEGLNVARNFEIALALHDKLVPTLLWPIQQRAALAYYNQLRVHFAWCAIRMANDRDLARTILRPLRRLPRSRRELAARLCISSAVVTRLISAWLNQPALS